MKIFFIAPRPSAVKNALAGVAGQRANGWRPDGTDPQVIGCVTHGDPVEVRAAFATAGILVLPADDQVIAPEHYALLARHGVLATDTVRGAITRIHKISGWPSFAPGPQIKIERENITMEFDLQHPLTEQEIEAWKIAKEIALTDRVTELEKRVTALEGKK